MTYDLTDLCNKYYRAYVQRDAPFNWSMTRSIVNDLFAMSNEAPDSIEQMPEQELFCISHGIKAVIMAIDPHAQFTNEPVYRQYVPDRAFIPDRRKKKLAPVLDRFGNEISEPKTKQETD